MREVIHIRAHARESLVDITAQVDAVWQHDQQDGNGDSHLKSGLKGPSETIPVIDACLGLSRWQNIFFCEFDGPRADRKVVVTLLEDH